MRHQKKNIGHAGPPGGGKTAAALFRRCLPLLLAALLLLSACGKSETAAYESLADFSGKRIGIVTGTISDQVCDAYVPDAQKVLFSSDGERYLGLASGKIDGTFALDYTYTQLQEQYPDIQRLPDRLWSSETYFGLAKTEFGAKLQGELNEYLAVLRENGELSALLDRWYNHTEEQAEVSFDDLTAINGTIRYTETVNTPPSFSTGQTGWLGIEAALLHDFALEYGYDIQVSLTEFTSILAGLTTGKYDLTSGLFYTEERAEQILFSDPYMEVCYYMVYMGDGTQTQRVGLLERLANSFEKNFIRENRWKLMANGLLVTIEIAVCSAVCGTILGILLCFVRRSRHALLSKAAAVFIRFLQGVPIVVLLLVLYYLIFANSSVSGVTVGIIGFSLDFGVYVAEILRSGLESVDAGQREAAEALGLSTGHIYTRIILPQALKISLPVYKGQFVSMVKSTSVVGYLTVQDLTKATDIIRARTYDAFFPLLVTTLIYFLLAWALTALIGRVELSIDPTRRKNILRGIDTAARTDRAEPSAAPAAAPVTSHEVLIEIEHLRREYELAVPLEDVNAVIREGDIISVIGPSGTGKSTLLRCINGLETPTSGTIRAFSREITKNDLSAVRARIGMVFQSFNLFRNLTVIENVMLAPTLLLGQSRQEAYDNAIALLDRVGLGEKALAYPDELSGGQKQRIAIVRAVAMNPRVLLFDEPTSALDPTMINEVQRVIRDLAQSGMTMLIVTHEMRFARDVANRVFYMDQGGIYEDGPVEQVFDHPKKERTRAFINKLSFFTFVMESPGFDFMKLQSDLFSFGMKEGLSGRTVNGLMVCAEELTLQGLKKLPASPFPAELAAEAGEDGSCRLILTYGGSRTDLSDALEELPKKLVRGLSRNAKYTFEGINRLSLWIVGS